MKSAEEEKDIARGDTNMKGKREEVGSDMEALKATTVTTVLWNISGVATDVCADVPENAPVDTIRTNLAT